MLLLRQPTIISPNTLDNVIAYVVNEGRTTAYTPEEYEKLCRFFVATDTIFSDTPAVDNGLTCAQIFVGTESLVTNAYGIKSDGEFVATLEDNIRKRGAMSKLISDRAKAQFSNKALDILRNYVIDDLQSEPYREHQNPAERRYQTFKQNTNGILDKSGAPSKVWFLALLYPVYLLNHLATDLLGGSNPLSVLTGLTTDISILFMFSFWEPVYFPTGDALSYAHKPGFPSESAERKGRFVGFGESVGDALTFKIFNGRHPEDFIPINNSFCPI